MPVFSESGPRSEAKPRESGTSRAGLNAANFFQAEAVGVVLPVLNAFLRASGWQFNAIGIATAAAGFGTLLMQTPAGLLTDRINSRRALFALSCLVAGLCFVFLPTAVHSSSAILAMLFTAGAAQSFLAPVLAALALSLVGHARLNRTIGLNQTWNHAGNIAAALAGIAIVARFGLAGIFYAVGVSSAMATALAVGGVVGPLITGELIQHLGFRTMFVAFAGIATGGAVWFQTLVPETSRWGTTNRSAAPDLRTQAA
jgi:MFS family permease